MTRTNFLGATFLIAALPACGTAPEGSATGIDGADEGGDVQLRSGDVGTGIAKAAVFRVVETGVDERAAAVLAAKLGLPRSILEADGAMRFIDTERFHRVPTMPAPPFGERADESSNLVTQLDEAVDFDALQALEVLADDEAIGIARSALVAAGLAPDEATPRVTHGGLQIAIAGEPEMKFELDTAVSFSLELDGIPMTGPGAKIGVTFDAAGAVTHLLVATRRLERGPEIPIVAQQDAPLLCREKMKGDGDELDVTAQLVYFAPPLSQKTTRILPHYRCGGRRLLAGRWTEVREVLVPAVLDAPLVEIDATATAAHLSASARIVGGTPPYDVEWTSSSGALASAEVHAGSVDYVAKWRTLDAPTETLSITVTDADGLVAVSSVTLPLDVQWLPAAGPAYGKIGAEWQGNCGGLPGGPPNASGFVNRFSQAGINASFAWGEYDAWEMDFKDNALTGVDASYADNVDATFFTGHADGIGFFLCGNNHDNSMDYPEARWGNNVNMEWMTVAACGPLQDFEDGQTWSMRWGPAFKGLHLLMGYQTVSSDVSGEGSTFANYMIRSSSPLTVKQAWEQTAIEQQGSGVIYATMGVMAFNGSYWYAANYSDRFWGMGTTYGDFAGNGSYWKSTGDSY